MARSSGRGRRPSRRPAGGRRAAGGSRGGADRARLSGRALIALGEAATAGLTPAQMLELVVAAAGALTGEATVHLWLLDEDRRELRLVAESGARRGRTGKPFQP